MKYYMPGRWVRLIRQDAIAWYPPGYMEEGAAYEGSPEIVVPREALTQLVPFLDEEGFIKPRLDERLRTEDLKITHRLLDTVQRLVEKV